MLTVRGPMKAKNNALNAGDLVCSNPHSRPHTSKRKPVSEAHFKDAEIMISLEFPKKFETIEQAICRRFFGMDNEEHHSRRYRVDDPRQGPLRTAEGYLCRTPMETRDTAFISTPERSRASHPAAFTSDCLSDKSTQGQTGGKPSLKSKRPLPQVVTRSV